MVLCLNFSSILKKINHIFAFQLNPEHTVPTLVDDDFVIWDSHAICAYLVDKYAKDDKLYPKDLQLRAKCNQRLFFEAGSLFVRLRDCTFPILFGGATEVSQDKIDSLKSSLDILEAFLVSDPFLVGSNLTIADISLAMSVHVLDIYVPIKADTHPKTSAWLRRVSETVPVFDEINAEQLKQFRERVMNAWKKNKENK